MAVVVLLALMPSIYLLGGWDRNKFAGISRRFEEGGGLVFKAATGARTTLRIEAGLGGIQQRDLSGSAAELPGRQGRAGQIGDLARRPLSSHIAFKAGYVIHFDNRPEPGFEQTDRYLTSGLQVVF
jgi:hypothetical protein